MDQKTLYDVAVIGSGAAGSMATLRAVLNNLNTVNVLGNSKSKKRSRAAWVRDVQNMPGMYDRSKSILSSSKEVFQWIESEKQWSDNLHTIKDSVEGINHDNGYFSLTTTSGETLHSRYVLLSTGVMDVQPIIQGEIKPIFPYANKGFVEYCIRCDGHRTKGKDTSVIGHSESAAHVALILKERYDNPSMNILLNGQPSQLAQNPSLERLVRYHNIGVYESPIVELQGDPRNTGLEGFLLEDNTFVESQIAFVALGTIVYNELAKALGCKVDEQGYVVTDKYGETNVPRVFVAGDLRAGTKKQIYTAWDMAVNSVDKIDLQIRKERRQEILNLYST